MLFCLLFFFFFFFFVLSVFLSSSSSLFSIPIESWFDDDNDRDDIGAEGGDSGAAVALPGQPAKDSSPLGDTDQHSGADA